MAWNLKNLFRKKQKSAEPAPIQNGMYRITCDTASVIRYNSLMNGITSSRGEAMGFLQENILVIETDGTFTLTKELKSTKTNLLMKQPVSVKYIFTGSYTREGDKVFLSRADSGHGHVDWGSISRFLDTGNGDYDSTDSPGILSLYPTAFFVENCKNVPMTVNLDDTAHSFTIEEFEPVILSTQEAGAINKQEQALDPQAGLMKHPPVTGEFPYVLRDTYAQWGLKIGTCINPDYLESPYVEILATQFNSVTLENHLKPEHTLSHEKSLRTGKLSVAFSPDTVRLLDWCKEQKMPLRGHTLIWYLGTPEWIFHKEFIDDAPNVDRETMLRRMEDYIADFFAVLHEGDWDQTMYCIDVVNEAVIAPDRMRKCQWKDIIGDDYLLYAYRFARKYAPVHMKLGYNDFDLETKTDKVIELINSLKGENGVSLVDVIGQQGHYGAYSSIETLSSALKKLAGGTGCELQITELDVSISRQGTEEELQTQGRFYYNFVQEIRKLREEGVNITGLTLWGFADALSWMPSGFLHIYDRKLTPKYAYYGLLGLWEYAGFQGEGKDEGSGWTEARFVCIGETDRFIELHLDGSYIDTVLGTRQTGRYRFDGRDTYMLIPSAGSYCNLIVNPDGGAQRVEAAGGVIQLEMNIDYSKKDI